MPDSISIPVQEAAAVAAQLSGSRPDPSEAEIEAVAEAYDEVMSDPAVRTSHDAAKYILDALEEAGHQPFDFRGKRKLDFDAIEMALHAISTTAVKVEMLGRCAV